MEEAVGGDGGVTADGEGFEFGGDAVIFRVGDGIGGGFMSGEQDAGEFGAIFGELAVTLGECEFGACPLIIHEGRIDFEGEAAADDFGDLGEGLFVELCALQVEEVCAPVKIELGLEGEGPVVLVEGGGIGPVGALAVIRVAGDEADIGEEAAACEACFSFTDAEVIDGLCVIGAFSHGGGEGFFWGDWAEGEQWGREEAESGMEWESEEVSECLGLDFQFGALGSEAGLGFSALEAHTEDFGMRGAALASAGLGDGGEALHTAGEGLIGGDLVVEVDEFFVGFDDGDDEGGAVSCEGSLCGAEGVGGEGGGFITDERAEVTEEGL